VPDAVKLRILVAFVLLFSHVYLLTSLPSPLADGVRGRGVLKKQKLSPIPGREESFTGYCSRGSTRFTPWVSPHAAHAATCGVSLAACNGASRSFYSLTANYCQLSNFRSRGVFSRWAWSRLPVCGRALPDRRRAAYSSRSMRLDSIGPIISRI